MRMKISLLIVLNIKVTVDLRAHTCMDALLFIFSVSVLAVGGGEGGRGGGGGLLEFNISTSKWFFVGALA